MKLFRILIGAFALSWSSSFSLSFSLQLLICATALFSTSNLSAAAPSRPNIIIIMSDDMGYSDLGCYGGVDANTPNLDRLANGGLRFTQFYNTARCCPTRASLLTGLYPHQAGTGHMTDDRGSEGYRGNLNRRCVTIAEVLKPAGYRTYMTGKWHVTNDFSENGDKANWPLQRGFEKYYGTLIGAGNFFDPDGLCRQNMLITCQTDPEYRPEQFYYTDAISDNSVRFLDQHKNETPEKPFLLYVAYTAAHWPMQAPEKEIARYRGKFNDGYLPHRVARLEKMKKLGLVPSDTTLSPGSDDWSRVKHQDWDAECMAVYCAMIENMDTGIGRIVSHLKESGQFQNTLILFLQDNGACAETIGRAPGGRANETFKGRPVRTGPEIMPGPGDTYIAYGRGWANVSNTPFREYKHWVHEGGISTPLVAHWPQGISQERNGELESQPAHLIDLMATCVDLAAADYPREYGGIPIRPTEGVSLRPAFHSQSLNRQQPLYWEHEANKAIRDGRWKLVAKANQPWELYDIQTDRIESINLATAQPDIARKLSEQWDAYAARANVLPLRADGSSGTTPVESTTKKRFELAPGAVLLRENAPELAGREISVTATVTLTKSNASGVILSQGGLRLGYALYLDNGKPVFVIRDSSGLHEIRGPEIAVGKHELQAQLSKSEKLHLLIDGVSAGPDEDCPLLTGQPGEGLIVGRDEGGAVGSYRIPNPFTETIHSIILELEPVSP